MLAVAPAASGATAPPTLAAVLDHLRRCTSVAGCHSDGSLHCPDMHIRQILHLIDAAHHQHALWLRHRAGGVREARWRRALFRRLDGPQLCSQAVAAAWHGGRDQTRQEMGQVVDRLEAGLSSSPPPPHLARAASKN